MDITVEKYQLWLINYKYGPNTDSPINFQNIEKLKDWNVVQNYTLDMHNSSVKLQNGRFFLQNGHHFLVQYTG